MKFTEFLTLMLMLACVVFAIYYSIGWIIINIFNLWITN